MIKTYENIIKIVTGQGDDYMQLVVCQIFLFQKSLQINAIDLSKQQALDADPRAIQQINFTGNLDRDGNVLYY